MGGCASRAVELFDAVKICSGNFAVEAQRNRAPNGRSHACEHHVTTADFLVCGANLGMKLLIQLSVADLRYFLRRLSSTSEFLIHKLHVNFLSKFEGENSCAHT